MGSLDKMSPMVKYKYIFLSSVLFALLTSCSTSKNTAVTRWYHSFNTRYNVYFNGDQAYQETLKNEIENYQENYTEMILMYPVSALPKEKESPGGPFDRAVEKSVKAIKTHSIQVKPERQPEKRNDPKYREWMNRTEYNPFLHNAWMMLGKSQFHNGDFLQAASTFSYVSRIYNTQPEIGLDAKIWQARCYSELEWYFEAEDILNKIDKNSLSSRLSNWYETVLADLLIKQKKFKESIPYLQTAIKAEKNKFQKTREKYLLGQVYSLLGERDLAYSTFGEVSSSNAPYILEFNAKIRQTEVYSGTDTTKVTRQLRNMAKSSKNKDYLDQLYYALGNVYMTVPDTAKAINSYKLGVEKSVQQGINKALNQIKLGDIYFTQKEFIKAQPNYSEALSQIKKGDNTYSRVSHRSAILDELVVYLQAIELQDSLLRLSRMSETERLKVVETIISELKKKEEEERKLMERDEFLTEQENTRTEMGMRPNPIGGGSILPPGTEGSFYFYNSQVVAQGKNTFQQKWGRRKLEDNWRRRNKSNPMSDPFAEEDIVANDTISNINENIGNLPSEETSDENAISSENLTELSTDPYDPQFYLQQIPVSEEDIASSNLIIADGLYNAAVIYKEKLEDLPLALETFEILQTRYPKNENKLKAYFHVYLIYLKEGNTAMSNSYKQKIRSEFPESDLAIDMSDPQYEYNLKMLYILPETLYQQAYEAYMNGNTNKVRENYDEMASKFKQSPLMPKFIFLNALSYVQKNDAEGFKEQLRYLINTYPDADVSILAAEMMKGFQKGLILSSSKDNMLARGNLFAMRFGELGEDGEPLEDVSEISFSVNQNTPYILLLMYSQGNINENMLLYTVANFNFGNFTVNDFDLEKTTLGNIGLLQIKGFNNFREISQYIQMIYAPEGYANALEQEALIVPISVENYGILMRGKSLEEYIDFFEENFGRNNRNLIDRWKLKQEKEIEDSFNETQDNNLQDEEIIPDELDDKRKVENKNLNIEQTISEIDTTQIVAKQDSIIENIITKETLLRDSLANDSVTVLPLSELDQKTEELEEKASEVLDKSSETLESVNKVVDEIMGDPVRGIKNLFKRKKSNPIDQYVKEQEKLEKERQEQLKKEKEEEEIALREAAKKEEEEKKALEKQKKEEEQALEQERMKKQEELANLKKAEQKAKEEEIERIRQEKALEKQRIQLEKEEAKKRREQERLNVQNLREEQKRQKEEMREAARTQRELAKQQAKLQREEQKRQRELEKEEARKKREQEKAESQKLRELQKQDVK